MKLVKPNWVTHDGLQCLLLLHNICIIIFNEKSNVCLLSGYPIFSIDIHPNGKRFATGGQGIFIYFIFFNKDINSFNKDLIYIKLEQWKCQ